MKEYRTYWNCDLCDNTLQQNSQPVEWTIVKTDSSYAKVEFLVCDKCFTYPIYQSTMKRLLGKLSRLFTKE